MTKLITLIKEGAESAEIYNELCSRADLNATDEDGNTFLHLVARNLSCEFVWKAKTLRAHMNARNREGQTPLHISALMEEAGTKNTFSKRLIRFGGDVNAKDSRGETPIFNAIFKNNLGLVKLFETNYADLNTKNVDGDTPLCFAKRYGRAGIEEYLKSKGAKEY